MQTQRSGAETTSPVIISAMPVSARTNRPRLSMFLKKKFFIPSHSTGFDDCKIPAWELPHRFVDEQRRGPYRVWTHEHRFILCAGGAEVVDFVKYLPPGGGLTDRLFVRRDVETIFRHRLAKLRELFS
jgi:ligand-binding SRPBCC domain-containing protein